MQITNYLYSKELHLLLKGRLEKMIDNDGWKLLDRKTMSLVRLSLAKNVAKNTTKAKMTIKIIHNLSKTYEKPSAMNNVHIVRRLMNLRMGECKYVSDHVVEFSDLVMQLTSVEILLADEVQDLLLMSSLPKSWNTIVKALSASSGKSTLTFDNIKDFIISEELRMKELGNAIRSALSVGTGDKTRLSSRNGGIMESRSNLNWNRSKSRWKRRTKKDKAWSSASIAMS